MILKIGGRDCEIDVSWGKFAKSTKRRTKADDDSNPELLIDDIWLYLRRNLLGLKPFIFKCRMRNRISLEELLAVDKIIASAITVEGREGGNSPT